ncbi:GAF domain-containing protein [Psychrobacillus sp.]|uniref:GAF domain-containing protein n=1 Tax=Psychrobacillus sp. TaxID=1871623 RepID=UPI0028BD7F7D|nr:GAF domain-containing protein [Psychrobacillus sp.]
MNQEKELLLRLNTFIQVSKNITSNKSLKQLIQSIIEEVINAIDKADAGFLILWDEEEELLKIEAAVNFKEEMYLKNKLQIGEGISGEVFATGKSTLINGEQQIQEAMSSMRNQSLQYYLKSTVHSYIPKSCMSVPIIHQQKKIGILTIDNFLNDGYFTEDELTFLEAIGSQIAISIVTARTFLEQEERTKQLETILTLHNQLYEATVKGNGLKALFDKLATIIQGRVFYFDPLLHLEVTNSRSIENVPYYKQWIQHNSEALVISQQILPIKKDNSIIGHALAVQSSFGTIGYLLIEGLETPIEITKELMIKHASSIIAIEQIKYQEHYKYEKEEKGKLLSELLQQNLTSEVQHSLKKYGMLDAVYYNILAIKNEQLDFADFQSMNIFEQTISRMFSKDYYVISFPSYQGTFVLLGSRTEHAEDSLSRITLTAEKFLSIYSDSHISIGRAVNSLQHVSISYTDAELISLEAFDSKTSKQIQSFRDLGIKRHLLELNEEEQHYFIKEILGPILSTTENGEKNELMITLNTYFYCNKNVVLTAKTLHLHQNSVYYRLQQLQEKLNYNFDNVEDISNIDAALFLYNRLKKR